MKKIILVMNVDWGWIKQRPHFIALKLAEYYDVTVCYQYRYKRNKLQNNESENINLIPIKAIPKISSYEYFRLINDNIVDYKICKIIKKEKPQIVILTYPTQRKCIPKNYLGEVYYDCMDNHIAFYKSEFVKNIFKQEEIKIFKKSKKIFFSSQNLLDKACEEFDFLINKVVLVRNAYDGNIINPKKINIIEPVIKMAYIGTISSWFDFDTILEVLQKKENIEFHLYGPLDKVEIPNNHKIIYHGVIEHKKLYETIKNFDCLIMPFVLNEIIKAVDPVKIYEYINFNKNIIMRKYPEVDRFGDFVYFYNNSEDFLSAILDIEQNRKTKYSMESRIEFLQENTWDKRVDQIKEAMENKK